MNPTNIHVAPAICENPSGLYAHTGRKLCSSVAETLPRLRALTNDPSREYAQRPGEVDRLPDSVAALILCKQGFSKVGRNGITIDLDGKPFKYWSENSVTIATKSGTNDKDLWTVNRHQPDVLHILSADGEYIESIPLDGKVPWFDETAAAKELGAKRRAQQRSMDRVRMLHAPDAKEEIARTEHNTAQITGLVRTFPSDVAAPLRRGVPQTSRAESGARETPAIDSHNGLHSARDFPRANRIHEIQRDLTTRREAHLEREKIHQSAARIGAAISASEKSTSNPPTDGFAVANIVNRTSNIPPDEEEVW